MASLHVILNEKRISHVFISLNAAPTKVWACAILQRLPTAGYLRMPRKSKGFILLPRQSIFSALSQAEGWCWAGMRVKRLPVGLAPANDQRRTGANRFLSLRPQFPPLKNGWCVCWGSLLEGLLSLPPVLTCWNLIFPSPSASLYPPRLHLSSPFLLSSSRCPVMSTSPVNQTRSAQSRHWRKNIYAFLADDNLLMPLLQKRPFFGVKRRAAKICVSIMGSRKGGHSLLELRVDTLRI